MPICCKNRGQELREGKKMKRFDILSQLIKCLSRILDEIEGHTSSHAQGVANSSISFADEFGFTLKTQRSLYYAALLHDIGETTLPHSILYKNGPLLPAERKKIESHSIVGYKIVKNIPSMTEVADLIRHHHESWDGTGYPDQLMMGEFTRAKQILAICDLNDTLSRERPYRPKRTNEEIENILNESKGTRFQPDIVEKFIKFKNNTNIKKNSLKKINEIKDSGQELSDFESQAYLLAISVVFSNLIGEKIPFLATHPSKVALLSVKLGEAIGMNKNELFEMKIAAFLGDIGILAQDEKIYMKKDKLSPEDIETINNHTLIGERATSEIVSLPNVSKIIRNYHESWDGSGYPDGIKGSKIPLASRILRIADTYVALQHDRPYRKGKQRTEITESINTYLKNIADPSLVNILMEIMKN